MYRGNGLKNSDARPVGLAGLILRGTSGLGIVALAYNIR